MVITWPSNTAEITDEIRDAIGRDVTIYVTVSGIPCVYSGCYLDPVTNLSTNSFCPSCAGSYWRETVSGYEVLAHVRMLGMDLPVYMTGGIVETGDATVQIKYTKESIYAVEHAKYYVVDNKTFIQKDFDTRGVPTINRIVVTLVEKEG